MFIDNFQTYETDSGKKLVLGTDKNAEHLFINGKRVATELELSRWQFFFLALASFSTFVLASFAAAQYFTA